MNKIVIIMTLIVVGCVPKEIMKPQYTGPDAATVNVYESWSIGLTMPILLLNDEMIGQVNKEGIGFKISPGMHKLQIHTTQGTSLPLKKEFAAGKTYFYNITVSLDAFYLEEITESEYKAMIDNLTRKQGNR